MIITSFKYQVREWSLCGIQLGNLNLIVGKNAVGKSRALSSLVQVARFVKGELADSLFGFQCELKFTLEDNEEMEYSFSVNDNKIIVSELLKKNDLVVVDRKGSEAKIKGETFNPPANKLCIQSQRDTANYPEFEEVIKWSEQIKGFSFSDLSSSNFYTIPSMSGERIKVEEIYKHISVEKRGFVIEKMRDLDYEIESINPIKVSEEFFFLTLKEKGISRPIIVDYMSNGMLRVFCIFMYLAYLSSEEGPRTLLIDDLGEGLDYSRSKKLSKIIFDYCEKHKIQLVVTSNDNFLMNAVDLKHWIILQREKELVTAISERTHPDIFKRFKRTGLNNFDLFSTDFLNKYLKS